VWMTYVLANSYQYSPAFELSTVSAFDVQQVYTHLYENIKKDRPIQEIAFDHMVSLQNWRRFRSPEDNTREMMELFLHQMNDPEVPLAAKACQNWSLSSNYQLVIDANVNTEPQQVLGQSILTCQDFYRTVVNHPDFIPSLAEMLVRYFFSALTELEKELLAEKLANTHPVTYRDLFTTLIFSEAYLLYAERPKGFEELFYNTAYRLNWRPGFYFFRNLRTNLNNMNQPVFQFKLGHYTQIPLDTLSFAWSHATVRNWALLDRRYDDANPLDQGWNVDFYTVPHVGTDFLRYLFLSMLAREPSDAEVAGLTAILTAQGYDLTNLNQRNQITWIVLDYFSRLPEFYFFDAIFTGETHVE